MFLECFKDEERVTKYWSRYKFQTRESVLNIQNLECEDQGTYICKGVNGFGVQEISFQLELFSKFNKFCYNVYDLIVIISLLQVNRQRKLARPTATKKTVFRPNQSF